MKAHKKKRAITKGNNQLLREAAAQAETQALKVVGWLASLAAAAPGYRLRVPPPPSPRGVLKGLVLCISQQEDGGALVAWEDPQAPSEVSDEPGEVQGDG